MDPRSELRQYYEVLRRHVAIIGLVVALAVGGVGLTLVTQGRQYQSDVSVLVTPQIFGTTSEGNTNLASFQSEYRTLVVNDILYLAKSSEVLHRVAQLVPGVRGADLYRAVKVTTLPNTDIILVSVRDPQPQRAGLIATTLTQQLVQYYGELNQASAAGTRKFIGEQVSLTKNRLQAAEEALRAFKSRTNISGLPDSSAHLIQRSFELQSMYNAAILDARAAEMRAQAIQQRLRSEPDGQIASVEIGTNPVVSQLRDKMVAAESDLANLRQVYTDQHPKVQQALGALADLRARLQQEASKAVADRSLGVSPIRQELVQQLVGAQVDGTVARARAEGITPLLSDLQAGLSNLPANELTFARLQRDVKLNDDLYMRLSSMYQDSMIAEQRAGGSGQAALVMVDQGGAPVSQQIPLKAGLAMMLGLVMGSVLALLVDNLDNRVRTPGDAEGTYGVPVLASIPTMNAQTHRAFVSGESAAVVGLVLPFVIPFLFVALGGVLAGLLVTKVGPSVGSVAGHAAASVMQLLNHVPPHVG
jgi:polysaccharide biosynthesis transport protein